MKALPVHSSSRLRRWLGEWLWQGRGTDDPLLAQGAPSNHQPPLGNGSARVWLGSGCGMVGVSAPGGWQRRGRRERRRMRWQRRPRRPRRRRRRVRRRVARGSFGRSLGRDPGSLYDAPFAPPLPPPNSPKKWTSPVDVAHFGGVERAPGGVGSGRGVPPPPPAPSPRHLTPYTLHLKSKP